MYFLLFYDYVPNIVDRRAPFREAHLALARAAQARGELLLGGAYADTADGALLVFRAADASVVEAFVRHDPYVLNGLVPSWKIRPWTVVTGSCHQP
jgi:uncharacterized protein YciI